MIGQCLIHQDGYVYAWRGANTTFVLDGIVFDPRDRLRISPDRGPGGESAQAELSGNAAMANERDSEVVRLRGWRFGRWISLGHIFTATIIA